MATKLEEKIDPALLYEADFYAWAVDQAGALRQLQAMRPSLPLDFEHLIEEVEDLGDSRLRAARSQLVRLLQHLLKLEHSPADRPRRQRLNSVDDARRELRDAMTATIRKAVEPQMAELYDDARIAAGRELRDHAEAAAAAALPQTCPYTLDQLLAKRWYPASRHGHVDEPF
jgi:hypothetical protein